MSDSDFSPRTASLAALISARLDRSLSEHERAAIAQLAEGFLDEAPYSQPPELTTVSVLMADLRGFSALTAANDPEVLVSLLQPFFTRMTQVIHDHGGFVDKFLGDGIMALFGAPAPSEDHLLNALRCAAQMQCAMEELNRHNGMMELPHLYAGISVNSGEVMSGSFGSDDYREYTVLGEAVTLAARMEKFALRGEVLLSEQCFEDAKHAIEVGTMRRLRARGHTAPITLYTLSAVTHPPRIEVPNVEMRSSPRVPVNLPLRYHAVDDQRVLPEEHEGNIINLGYGGMLAKLPRPLPSMGEITFALAPEPTTPRYEDVYARALHQQQTDDGFQTAFAFTSVGDSGREAVRRYVDHMLWGP